MSNATFTFRVDEALKAEFARAAKACDRSAAQLLRDFMRSVVHQQQDAAESDAWFRHEVQAALVEANDPSTAWVSNEQIESERTAWRRRILADGETSR